MALFSVAVEVLVASGLAALAAGPIALAAVIAAGAAAFVRMRGAQPSVDGAATRRRGSRWLVGSAAAIAGAVAIPAVDGGELNQPWWSAMAAMVIAVVVFAAIGAGLVFTSDRAPRARTTP